MKTTSTPTDPRHLKTLLRVPAQPLPYRAWSRWADTWRGRSDGRAHQGGRSPLQGLALPQDATAWLRANSHQLHERQTREHLQHHALVLPLTTRASELTELITTASADLDAAQTARDAVPDQPDQPDQRRVHEAATPEQVVRLRRAREHHRTRVAPAAARVATAQDRLAQLQDEHARVQADLTALEDVLARRVSLLNEYHARRAATYERAYLRAATTMAARRRPAQTDPEPRLNVV